MLEGDVLNPGHGASLSEGGSAPLKPNCPAAELLLMGSKLKLAAAVTILAYAGGAAALLWHTRG